MNRWDQTTLAPANEEFMCPGIIENAKEGFKDFGGLWVTTDYCESTNQGNGCIHKDLCVFYLEQKSKEKD